MGQYVYQSGRPRSSPVAGPMPVPPGCVLLIEGDMSLDRSGRSWLPNEFTSGVSQTLSDTLFEVSASTTKSRTSAQTWSGLQAIKALASADAGSIWISPDVTTKHAVSANQAYTFSAAAALQAGGARDVKLRVEWYTAGDALLSTSDVAIVPTSTLAYYRGEVTSHASAAKASHYVIATVGVLTGEYLLATAFMFHKGSANLGFVAGGQGIVYPSIISGPDVVTFSRGLARDFSGGVGTDLINLGKDSRINDLAQVTREAVVHLDGYGGGDYGRISDKANWRWFTQASDSSLRYAHVFAVLEGQWKSNIAMPTARVAIIHVTYDRTSTANDPALYLDGLPMGVTEVSEPQGAVQNDASSNLIAGNLASGIRAMDGRLILYAEYNRVMSASEVGIRAKQLGGFFGVST